MDGSLNHPIMGDLTISGEKIIYNSRCIPKINVLTWSSIYSHDLTTETPYNMCRGVIGLASCLSELPEDFETTGYIQGMDMQNGYIILNNKYIVWFNKSYYFVVPISNFVNKEKYMDSLENTIEFIQESGFVILKSKQCLHSIPLHLYNNIKERIS